MSEPAACLEELRARPIEAVVIGTSAGGIEALGELLPRLPADFPATVLIVIHLPPDRPSLLPEIFGPRCALRVREAEDKEPIEPGTVYFAPPDYHLLVESNRTLSLSSEAPIHFSRPSIDPLFESAAWTWGERLLGIVLTGASEDGAEGLSVICRRGGLAWVQAPDTATVPLMPQAARAACPTHHMLSLQEMAGVLSRLGGD